MRGKVSILGLENSMCKGPETGRVRGRKEVESGGWAEMGPLMKPEEVSRVQGKRREEEPTRCVRNALEETEVCGNRKTAPQNPTADLLHKVILLRPEDVAALPNT